MVVVDKTALNFGAGRDSERGGRMSLQTDHDEATSIRLYLRGILTNAVELESKCDTLSYSSPTQLLAYGLTNADLFNPKAGVPLMSYGYMISYEWMGQFCIDKGLCELHKIKPNSGPIAISGSVARRLVYQLRLQNSMNLETKQALMKFFEMQEEARWFITEYMD
ncbi:hypothetical protein EIP91_006587 [Steccherinum ochraceum]|uniref:Uncharacterized protein n=1 Tax=Steccherinum ochraceum TaxID=92696 RepID=A0A4R0RBB4_9APHY|nr:hypothetical protein EIP91_006587 [Steccherinum ochraceum]